MKENKSSNKTYRSSINKMATTAVFIALAYIATCGFHIKVQFLTLDIKDSLIAVAAMLFGPISAVVISLAVSLIEMFTISETYLYGFIMNVLSTVSFCCTASIIYKYKRNIIGAVVGMISGVFAMTATMMIANLLITPFYMGVTVKEVAFLIPKLLLPFNFTKALLNASVVMIIYKPISTALRRMGVMKKGSLDSYRFDKRTVLVTVMAAAVTVISLVVFFVVLGGDIVFWI